MRRLPLFAVLLAWACLGALPARAQSQLTLPSLAKSLEGAPEGRSQWSAISADTVGTHNLALNFQVGYPGISAALLAGQTEKFDLGARFSFLYGSEAGTYIAPGLRLQGLLRFLAAEHGRVKLGIEIEPGIFTYFGPYNYPYLFRYPGASFGIAVPIKFTLGIWVLRQLALHAAIDLPLMFTFVPFFEADIPILLGGGLEYFVLPDLSLNFKMRFGPSIFAVPGFAGVRLGLDILFGVAIRL